jgi:acyl dehydratase
MAMPPNHLVATLKDHLGHDLGVSSPQRLERSRMDRFAACTGDDQRIHVDVERARVQAPQGITIVHRLLRHGG